MSDAPVPAWFMNGSLVGSCNCEWGCPCNFDAPPTYGFCDGFYALAIREGRFGDVPLNGLAYVFGGHSPGPVHEGGGTEILVIDERSTPEQAAAVERQGGHDRRRHRDRRGRMEADVVAECHQAPALWQLQGGDLLPGGKTTQKPSSKLRFAG